MLTEVVLHACRCVIVKEEGRKRGERAGREEEIEREVERKKKEKRGRGK